MTADTIRVPDDAGEHADALRCLLERIPDIWGPWISCGPGWYPILDELQARLSELVPGYEVQQVKEKFGTLRFYWSWPEGTPEETYKAADAFVTAAEHLSARMCEQCGSGGGRIVKQNGFWLKTLCHRCSP